MRLALEAAGEPYRDVARGGPDQELGVATMMAAMHSPAQQHPPFAPPFLVDGQRVIAQTAAILLVLGPRLGLVGKSDVKRVWTHQLQLTVADAVAEAHDTHHPLATPLLYKDLQEAAVVRASAFCEQRMPKFLAWFQSVLERNPAGGRYLVGARMSYADLSLFQLVEGLRYAFPKASRRALRRAPRVSGLHASVAQHRRVAAYLSSTRRIPFNEDDIFRRYPALDG